MLGLTDSEIVGRNPRQRWQVLYGVEPRSGRAFTLSQSLASPSDVWIVDVAVEKPLLPPTGRARRLTLSTALWARVRYEVVYTDLDVDSVRTGPRVTAKPSGPLGRAPGLRAYEEVVAGVCAIVDTLESSRLWELLEVLDSELAHLGMEQAVPSLWAIHEARRGWRADQSSSEDAS